MTPLLMHYHRKRHGISLCAELVLELAHQAHRVVKSPLRVDDIITLAGQTKIASPATTHREIHWLIDNGYTTIKQGKDRRVRFVRMTAKGDNYLRRVCK